MDKTIKLACLLAIIIFSSCASRKDFVYLQDMDELQEYPMVQKYEAIIHRDDRLSIIVNSKNPELSLPFNMSGSRSYSVEADEEALHKVIRLACAEFVFSLPEGLDTKIGEHGYGLSEGQAQRIAIARALLRPGRIWLFDEASSALDTETTTHLMDNLLQWGKNNTLIFVTHDSRLMERCDQVIHIKE